MMKRNLIALFLALVVILSMTSCGFIIINDISGEHESEPDETDTVAGDKDPDSGDKYTKYEEQGVSKRDLAKEFLAELPERYYDGAAFFITTPSTDYISPDEMGEAVSKLAHERNREVEDLLGITIVTTVCDASTMLEEVKQAEKTGMYYTDLMMVPIYMIGQYRVEDVLLNMRSIPFFDIDKPYFNKASSDMTSGGYSTYGVAGHASISPSSLSAVYMNKSILTEAGVDVSALYKSAADGTWTWDNLIQYNEAVRTLNGEKKATDESFTGYYTFTAQNTASRLPDLIFKSAGNDFVKTGKRKVPSIGYSLHTVEKTMEIMKTLYNDEYAITSDTAGAVKPFSEGRSVFLVDYLDVMETLTGSATDFGILPLPKAEEKDDYRTLVANTELVFAIPKSHTNTEFAGITLSALNAASYGYIYDEYVDYSMMNYLRDNESIGMLDMILDTAEFDFALAFGNAYPEIANATYKLIREFAKNGNIADYFEERGLAARAVFREKFDLSY